MLLCSTILLAGCSKISTDYGTSKGLKGRHSLNGFGALRTSYEQAAFRSRDVTRLTDRVRLADVIVWTPQLYGSIDTKVTNWFDRWLSGGNKTLVYIVPDSGSETDYWIDAGKLAPPAQRMEYRKRAARSINERMAWRLNRGAILSNGWFRIEPRQHRTALGDASGPWAPDVLPQHGETGEISTEYLVAAFDADKEKVTAAAINTATGTMGKTGPASPGWWMNESTSPTSTPIDFQTVLRTEQRDAIIATVTSRQWKNSKIVVVAGGSLLTNYAFTRPLNRRLAGKIIAESKPNNQPTPLVGFLTSSWASVPVSETKPGLPTATGMELLTVWPISLVTMHGVMLGLVICLMLWPIFGRARNIQRVKHSDFGDHIDAVATLMQKAKGEHYARARISEYFKRVHGETSGPWVIPDPPKDLIKSTHLPSHDVERLQASSSHQHQKNANEEIL